jgi:large subunit ribosomal protein L15
MQTHTFKPNTESRLKKRVGRGGKRGTTSGKGQKGQSARAGRKKRPAERDILSKFPKLRGIGNAANRREETFEIYLNDIAGYAENGVLSRKTLVKKGLIRRTNAPVKIVLRGEVKSAYTVEGIPASAAAKKKIEEKGGTVS